MSDDKTTNDNTTYKIIDFYSDLKTNKNLTLNFKTNKGISAKTSLKKDDT